VISGRLDLRSSLLALAVGAALSSFACASSKVSAPDGPASSAAREEAYARPRRAFFDLGLRQLLEARDGDLAAVARTFRLLAPTVEGGTRHYRVLAVLEVGANARAAVDVPGLTVRSRLGRVLSLSVTEDGLRALAENPEVLAVHAVRLGTPLNEVATSASSARRVTVPPSAPVDTSFPVVAGKTYTFLLTAKSPRATNADPVLTLCRDAACAGPNLLASDDNGGPGTDARLTYTASQTETLLVRATDKSGQTMEDALTVLGSNGLPLRLGSGARSLWADGLRGSGAIVGVVDSGFDFCHDDFVRIDPSTSARRSRLLALWDQELLLQGSETAPSFSLGALGSATAYGVQYLAPALDAALGNCGAIRSVDEDGHGTHVMGTAAGNGRGGVGELYAGAAPEAALVGVKLDFASGGGIVDGVAYAVAVAESVQKPLSVNLSIGFHSGPHDGTDPESLGLLAVSGPGRSIAVAAGNEGTSAIAARSIDAPPAVDDLGVTIASGTRFERDGGVFVWLDAATDFRVSLIDNTGAVVATAEPGQSKRFTFGGVQAQLAYDRDRYDANGDVRQAAFVVTGWNSASTRITLRLERLRGSGTGRWWGWSVPDTPAAMSFADHRTQAGDGAYLGTMNDLASSHAVLAVGATASLVRVKKEDGGPESDQATWNRFGTIASFSSRGPGRDGRAKPDVVTPGMYVVSTLSRSAPNPNTIVETGKHQKMQGTSMASPGAAGVAAQLLAFDPTLVAPALLGNTGVRDSAVAALDQGSANTWGSGKLDAFAARARLVVDAAPSATFRDGRRDPQGIAHLAVDVTDADGAADLAYVLWDVDGDGANDWVTKTDSVALKLVGNGPYTARAIVVDKAGKSATVTTSLVLEPLAVVDAGAPDAGAPDAGSFADAGAPDAGLDAASMDASAEDATPAPPAEPVRLASADGCAVHASRRAGSRVGGSLLVLALAAGLARRRRAR
jgi:subtilisin family serine protease